MTRRKLIVEVVDAHDLMGKDEEGSSSPYVVVDYDEQVRRTRTKHKDLNPVWTEKLEFIVTDPKTMAMKELEAIVYTDKILDSDRRHEFLGRVKISGRQFVQRGEEALVYFPLEKRNIFSRVKGELGLAIYYVDERTPPIPEEKPTQAFVPAAESSSAKAGPDGYPPGEAPAIDGIAATEPVEVASANAVPVKPSLPEAPPVADSTLAEEPPVIVPPTDAPTEAPPLAVRPLIILPPTKASTEAPPPAEGPPTETPPTEAPVGAPPPAEGHPVIVPPTEALTETPPPADRPPVETPPIKASVDSPPSPKGIPVKVPPTEATTEAPPTTEGSPVETPAAEASVEAALPAKGHLTETLPAEQPVGSPPPTEGSPATVPPTKASVEAPPHVGRSSVETSPTEASGEAPPLAQEPLVKYPHTDALVETPTLTKGTRVETPLSEAPVHSPPLAKGPSDEPPSTQTLVEAPPLGEGSPNKALPDTAPVKAPLTVAGLLVEDPSTEAPIKAPPPTEAPRVEAPPVELASAAHVGVAPTDRAYMVAAHVEDGLAKASPLVKEKPSGDSPQQGKIQQLQRKPRRKQRSHKKQSYVSKERAVEYVKNDLGGLSSAHDLAEKMQYLFVRIVKARSLPPRDLTTGTLVNPSLKIRIGDEIVKMRTSEKTAYPEWDQIFTFSREKLRSAPTLEISVWDEDTGMSGECLGGVCFDVSAVPTRVPHDGPLIPQWYKLDGNDRVKGDIMLAIWMGTQDVAEFIHGQKYIFLATA